MLKVLALFLLAAAFAEAQTNNDVTRWMYEAERGDARAQFWLGAAYESGRGVSQNFADALRWLTKSANQGNADAQNALGQMYEDSEGVPRNVAQAARWYRTACENRPDHGGAGQGCNNLGILYLEASDVRENRVAAYKYFKLTGNTQNLADVMSKMCPSEVADAEYETEKWLQAHPDR
jgi:TPR repeat protein